MTAILLFTLLVSLCSVGTYAQSEIVYSQLGKLSAFEGDTLDWVGYSVDISGEFAIAGAPGDDELGGSAGAAYILSYEDGSWSVFQKITASDGMPGDLFGISVAVSGNTAFVGAVGHDAAGAGGGAVYVFRNISGSWSQVQKLIPGEIQAGYQFGRSVSIDGTFAVAGARLADMSFGAAYVYRFNGSSWVPDQKLSASDGDFTDEFGYSVDVSGNRIIVGAFGEGGFFDAPGAAYVYSYDGSNWNEDAKLLADDSAEGDAFGISVAISGNIAIAGAYGEDDIAPGAGAAYVFEFDGLEWNQGQKLTVIDGGENDEFGFSVAISGNTMICGAKSSFNRGSAYVFDLDGSTWSQTFKLTASDPQVGDEFAYSVALNDSIVLIGSRKEDAAGPDAGALYLYKRSGLPPCNLPAAIPAGLQALVSPSGTTVSLSWSALEGAGQYQVKGQKVGTTASAAFITSNTSKNIGGLTPGASYAWKLRARCLYENIITGYSLTDTFTMPLARESLLSTQEEIYIYPNPAGDYVIVELPNSTGHDDKLTIIDINGRVKWQAQGGNPARRIPLDEFESGLFNVLYEGQHKYQASFFHIPSSK